MRCEFRASGRRSTRSEEAPASFRSNFLHSILDSRVASSHPFSLALRPLPYFRLSPCAFHTFVTVSTLLTVPRLFWKYPEPITAMLESPCSASNREQRRSRREAWDGATLCTVDLCFFPTDLSVQTAIPAVKEALRAPACSLVSYRLSQRCLGGPAAARPRFPDRDSGNPLLALLRGFAANPPCWAH